MMSPSSKISNRTVHKVTPTVEVRVTTFGSGSRLLTFDANPMMQTSIHFNREQWLAFRRMIADEFTADEFDEI